MILRSSTMKVEELYRINCEFLSYAPEIDIRKNSQFQQWFNLIESLFTLQALALKVSTLEIPSDDFRVQVSKLKVRIFNSCLILTESTDHKIMDTYGELNDILVKSYGVWT